MKYILVFTLLASLAYVVLGQGDCELLVTYLPICMFSDNETVLDFADCRSYFNCTKEPNQNCTEDNPYSDPSTGECIRQPKELCPMDIPNYDPATGECTTDASRCINAVFNFSNACSHGKIIDYLYSIHNFVACHYDDNGVLEPLIGICTDQESKNSDCRFNVSQQLCIH